LESKVDTVVARVVDRHTERLLDVAQVEVVRVARVRGGVLVWVADVVDAAAAVVVVRRFDIVTAHVLRFVADLHDTRSQFGLSDGRVSVVVAPVAFSSRAASSDLVEAAAKHVVCKLGIAVDGVVVSFDAVGVVYGKLGVLFSLDSLVDYAVDYTKRVEVHGEARHASVLDLEVLLVKVRVKGRAIVASVRLGKEVEFPGRAKSSNLCIKLGNSGQKSLEDVLYRVVISPCTRLVHTVASDLPIRRQQQGRWYRFCPRSKAPRLDTGQ